MQTSPISPRVRASLSADSSARMTEACVCLLPRTTTRRTQHGVFSAIASATTAALASLAVAQSSVHMYM